MSIVTKYFSLLLVTVLLVGACELSAQQYASKKVRSVHQAYTDSLKQIEYDYVFPILGQGAYQRGFDIPYPGGVMGNYMWMRQGIVIDNFQLGMQNQNNDIPLTPVDFIEFGQNTNTSYTVNVRPDIWIFPFLNVYGIFGYGNSHTEVNLVAPIELHSAVDQNIGTKGFGVMGAFGVGPVWFSVDANFTWNKPELLDKSVPVNVLGVRMGHTFVFTQKPYRNIGVWLGGMRAAMGASTIGQINLADALPPSSWERRDEIVDNYWGWYNSLNPNNPVDQRIIEKVDEVLTPIIDALAEADGSAIIRYGMDKQTKQKWNGVVGMQFQFNKHWMLRTEAGVIGDRKSFLLSANYRFRL